MGRIETRKWMQKDAAASAGAFSRANEISNVNASPFMPTARTSDHAHAEWKRFLKPFDSKFNPR